MSVNHRIYPNRNVEILVGRTGCSDYLGNLGGIKIETQGRAQINKVNFENTIILYTDNIKVNDIQTVATGETNGLINKEYKTKYKTELGEAFIYLLLQITKLYNNDNEKIKETKLQAYYTNDMKLKIRISKSMIPKLLGVEGYGDIWYWGTTEYETPISNGSIKFNINNPNVLGIRNSSNNPVKITIKPR